MNQVSELPANVDPAKVVDFDMYDPPIIGD